MNKPDSVIIFSNGNIAVFDTEGQQIPELQFSWLNLLCKEFERLGVNPINIREIKTIVNGRDRLVKPFRVGDNWNVSFEQP